MLKRGLAIKIREMEDIALRECNDQEFIPLKYRERHRELMLSGTPYNSFSSVERGGAGKR